jgi:excinuclease ABC subunit A
MSIAGAMSIADVLDMTVSEACGFFAGVPEVLRALEPIRAVGLEYVKLGQPVPTLSGGEAQRLKLAGRLASSRLVSGTLGAGTLFLFDEPTTGLHFSDIATLLRALRALIESGHSVVVIEHNLDVIAASDWVIDLGPEGGEAGGEVVCVGPPDEVAGCEGSHTGTALGEYFKRGTAAGKAETLASAETQAPYGPGLDHSILIRRAREHNLKNIDVRIPRDAFTVVTGVSGSGKSTVAFNILFAEGQRRYLESLNAYARQFAQPSSRPDVDGVFGVPPTVAIEQRTSRGGRKSTVATVTELYHFLRLLFVKLGTQFCPDCGVPIEPQTREAILGKLLAEFRGRRVTLLAPLVTARKGYYTDLAKWAAGKGFSRLRVDGTMIPTRNWPRLDRFREHTIEVPAGETVSSPERAPDLRRLLDLALDLGKGVAVASAERAGNRREEIFSVNRACPSCGRSFQELDPRLFSFNSKHGWCPACFGTGLLLPGFDEEQTGEEIWWNEWWEGPERQCPACRGRRLRPEALAVKFRNRSITDYTLLSVERAEKLFTGLKLKGREEEIARDIVGELRSRLAFLREVGLSYLSLDRAAPTLSGGEAQRIRLASQLGSNLRGVCYILDEPTIGLHARDNLMLLDTLERLKKKGNTVVVVEHDEETIRRAGHVVDLGPGGGVNGGRLVFEGTIAELLKQKSSVTARFLRSPLRHPLVPRRGPEEAAANGGFHLEIVGARLHNLKNLRVKVPLGRFVCVTGVSGSGKSTLVREVLYDNLRLLTAQRGRRRKPAALKGCGEIRGFERVARVFEVDQTPIGKTPRSCPATYVGFWDEVRRLFASTAEAKIRGYGPSRFSFNVPGGRCDECAGQGMKKIEMSFLPDVAVACEACGGKRFTPETLSVRFKEKSAGDVLDMSVDEAVDFFAAHSRIHYPLELLQDVGLGYIHLGQQSPTLSGGEAQRIKLVTELARTRFRGNGLDDRGTGTPRRGTAAPHTLYVLDEPTIGLHMADVEKLVRVLHRLVDAGNTVVIIEHNLDVIAEADWIIDLGPEGGDGGGRVVAQGSPEAVAAEKNGSYTGAFLSTFLKERGAYRHAHSRD